MAIPAPHWTPPLERRQPRSANRALDQLGVAPPVLATLLDAKDTAEREERWAAFVARYTPLLLHAARRFAHSYDEKMDRYTFLLDRLSRDDFRRLRAFAAPGPGRFTTWLVVVAHRLLVDYHRQLFGRPRSRNECRGGASTLRGRPLTLRLGTDTRFPDPDATSCDTEAETDVAECVTALQRAVTSLGPRDRQLLTLRFDRGLAAREIAGVMGFASQGHVYRRLQALLVRLRVLLPPSYREYVGAMP